VLGQPLAVWLAVGLAVAVAVAVDDVETEGVGVAVGDSVPPAGSVALGEALGDGLVADAEGSGDVVAVTSAARRFIVAGVEVTAA